MVNKSCSLTCIRSHVTNISQNTTNNNRLYIANKFVSLKLASNKGICGRRDDVEIFNFESRFKL